MKVQAVLTRNGQFLFDETMDLVRVPQVGEDVVCNHAAWKVTGVVHGAGGSNHSAVAEIRAEYSRDCTPGQPGGR